MTGETLGHYEIGERLGRGGTGEVYLATDLRLRRTVALKVLSPESAGDPDRRARFEREARAVAGLNHPNIVTVHSIEEADTADGTIHFIAMERVEGGTLAEWIAEDGLDVGRVLEIAEPLADAVGAAHRAGVTHRDLKPHNVMITSDGRVKVLDFGLAKLAATATDPATALQLTNAIETREGTIVGTVPYMSPEQVQGRPVGPPGDVFSLGVMIYEMRADVDRSTATRRSACCRRSSRTSPSRSRTSPRTSTAPSASAW